MEAIQKFPVVNLDRFAHLFPDREKFQEFVQAFTEALQTDLCPIMSGERIIGAALSEKGARDFLYERMVKRVSQRPELLSELTERFESDDLVE